MPRTAVDHPSGEADTGVDVVVASLASLAVILPTACLLVGLCRSAATSDGLETAIRLADARQLAQAA